MLLRRHLLLLLLHGGALTSNLVSLAGVCVHAVHTLRSIVLLLLLLLLLLVKTSVVSLLIKW